MRNKLKNILTVLLISIFITGCNINLNLNSSTDYVCLRVESFNGKVNSCEYSFKNENGSFKVYDYCNKYQVGDTLTFSKK